MYFMYEFIYLLEIENTFIQQGCIKLFKSESNGNYNVIKDLCFT